MTEEVIQQVNDPLAELAQQYGWDPQKGDKSSKEFIEYAMQNLEPRGKELKEVKQNLAAIQSNIEMLVQEKYEKKVQELEYRKLQAIESGNIEEVDKIYAEKQKLAVPVGMPSPAEAFLNRYSNVRSDASLEAFEIREFIQKRDEDLGKRSLSAEQHINILEQDMLKKFPNYFNKETPSSGVTPVTSPTGGVSKGKITLDNLTKEQRDVADYMISRGIPFETYVKGLKG